MNNVFMNAKIEVGSLLVSDIPNRTLSGIVGLSGMALIVIVWLVYCKDPYGYNYRVSQKKVCLRNTS